MTDPLNLIILAALLIVIGLVVLAEIWLKGRGR